MTNPHPVGLTELEAKLIELVAFVGSDSTVSGGADPDLAFVRDVLRARAGHNSGAVGDDSLTASLNGCLRRNRKKRRDRLKGMSEKQAVEVLVDFLGSIAPGTVAKAMGVAQSTLYSYSDYNRPNRPGPKRLYQASHLLRIQAKALADLADAIAATAGESAPALRGRSAETTPKVG
jgi:hypothetical protein